VPETIPAHIAIRDELKDSARYAVALSQVLEKILAVKPRQPSSAFHGKVDFSQPPWHAPAANAVMDFHALARKLENEVRGELDLPGKSRGGSDANTKAAVDSLLSQAERADDWLVRQLTREFRRWSFRALAVLGIAEFPRKLPRSPGEKEMKCPYCKNSTLRSFPGSEVIKCINPACRDGNGCKPEARMKYSELTRGWMMVWADGVAALCRIPRAGKGSRSSGWTGITGLSLSLPRCWT
jgi:hypothetical protein